MKTNKSSLKTFLLIIVIIALGFKAYNEWIYPSLKQSKQEAIEWYIKEVIKDDILFYAELAPAFCGNDGALSIIFYENEDTFSSNNNKEEGLREVVRIIENAEARLKKIKATDKFHEKLKRNLISALKATSPKKLLSKNMKTAGMEYRNIVTTLRHAFWKSGAEPYYIEKIKNSFQNAKIEFSVKDKIAINVLSSDYDESDTKFFIGTLNEIAMQNKSYKTYYDKGCLDLFVFELTKHMIRDLKKPEKSNNPTFQEIVDKAYKEYESSSR